MSTLLEMFLHLLAARALQRFQFGRFGFEASRLMTAVANLFSDFLASLLVAAGDDNVSTSHRQAASQSAA
jgi:hypothetical protein